ncbi:hypothetical protein DH2020_001192 [Rehmannia glutinosa]|uniref:Uncharacterized protein n=1 Tax=Rehmannia glutinosa TaxID=99300 RepID=A0ABR0XYQ3_REHGL
MGVWEMMFTTANNPKLWSKSSQNKTPFVYGGRSGGDAVIPVVVREIGRAELRPEQHLFMEEDEMASWLQYLMTHPSVVICEDLLLLSCSGSSGHHYRCSAGSTAYPFGGSEAKFPSITEISRISRGYLAAEVEPVEKPSVTAPKESTAESKSDDSNLSARAENTSSKQKGGDIGGGGGQPEAENQRKPTITSVRVRTTGFQAGVVKKQGCGSASSSKRSRAAQVHNLSERVRRRDRINEKMKGTLQIDTTLQQGFGKLEYLPY